MEKNKRQRIIKFSLIALPIIAFFISLCLGRYGVSPGTVFTILAARLPFTSIEPTWSGLEESVVVQLRMPRVILAMLIGAGLSCAGVSLQGLFRNPLVSSHILGVSAGAGFGAALGLLLTEQAAMVQLLALVFGIVAVIIAFLISHQKSGTSLLMLVLSGIIVGALFTALISLIKYVADPEEKLPTIVYWLMGSLAGASYNDIFKGAPLIVVGIVTLYMLRWRLNVLSLSEEEAQSLGINVQRLRWVVITAATVITASAVSLCGIVGWVGLIIPHIGRMLVGPDHKILLPVCISIGAVYLLFIDDLARSVTAAEIPLSILTAIIGAPFFAYLLRKTGGGWK